MSNDALSMPLLEIDLAAIRANYRTMRVACGPHVTCAAVVKCNAYGFGLAPVAGTLCEAGCRDFFVGDLDEGVQLRAACPDAAIAVFWGDIARYGAVYERYGLMPVLNTPDEVRLIVKIAPLLPFLLHVDTGLTRLGLAPPDLFHLHLAGTIDRRRLVGILSHLACAARPDDPTNELQRCRFAAICHAIRPPSGSLAASAGVWLGPRYHFDMVRPGSALFGLNDARTVPSPLRSVLRASAPIVALRDVVAHQAVGYAATFRTSRRSRIAVIGMGYAHGLPWLCGNRIQARLGPFSAPVVGRVSMESTTIDVTDLPDEAAHVGARVTFLDEAFGADDMADATGVAAQEIILRLGRCCASRHVDSEGTSRFVRVAS